MEGYTLTFTPVCLLLYWMLLLDSVQVSLTEPFPLTMAENSVDDMYKGCMDDIKKMIVDFHKHEVKNKDFKKAWKKAKARYKTKAQSDAHKALANEHVLALYAYTSDAIYSKFNKAVREGKNDYGGNFRFHYLHFWLTTAIQTLKHIQTKGKQTCETTYRRTKVKFTGKVGSTIRFGSFASSSKRKDLRHFGSETCFEVLTCQGAYIEKYSAYKQEKEVLIPPYEKFKVMEVIEKEAKPYGLKDCKIIFKLKSEGVESNLNCKLSKKA